MIGLLEWVLGSCLVIIMDHFNERLPLAKRWANLRDMGISGERFPFMTLMNSLRLIIEEAGSLLERM